MRTLNIKNLPKPLLIILATLFIIFLMAVFRKRPAAIEPAADAIPVAVIQTKKEFLRPQLTLYGRIESPYTADLTATVEANVLSTPKLEGSIVTPGMTIVKLEDLEAKLRFQQRQAQAQNIQAQIKQQEVQFKFDQQKLDYEQRLLELLNKSVAREQNLIKKRLGSEAQLDQALQALERQNIMLNSIKLDLDNNPNRLAALNASFQDALAQVNLAQIDLQRTNIKSPFLGRVAELDVNVGSRVQPGQTVAKVYDLSKLEARAQIPSKYLNTFEYALRKEKAVTATSNYAGEQVQFLFNRLSGRIELSQGGLDGFFRAQSHQTLLRLGAILVLKINLPLQANLVKIPPAALYGTNKIFQIIDNKLKPIRIKQVGYFEDKQGDFWLLADGSSIPDDSLILTTPIPNAITDMAVNIVEGVEPAPAMATDVTAEPDTAEPDADTKSETTTSPNNQPTEPKQELSDDQT